MKTTKRQIALQQHLPLKGLLNTREMGGCPCTIKGKPKQVKWGLLYRSGSPEYITPSDLAILDERNIKTVVDFRSEDEKTAEFNLLSLKKRVELPINAGNLLETLSETGDSSRISGQSRAEAEMLQMYSILPQEAIPPYRALFSLLSDANNMPLLYHCSAGKDRTGLASALILYALGASIETIMENYLVSSDYLRPYWKQLHDPDKRVLPYYIVKKEYLLAAFSSMESYGGIDSYLVNELKVDHKLLQELYTEPIMTS